MAPGSALKLADYFWSDSGIHGLDTRGNSWPYHKWTCEGMQKLGVPRFNMISYPLWPKFGAPGLYPFPVPRAPWHGTCMQEWPHYTTGIICCGRADHGPKIKKARICHMIQVQRAPKRDSWGTASSVSTTFVLWIGEVRKASSRQVICIGYSWLVH